MRTGSLVSLALLVLGHLRSTLAIPFDGSEQTPWSTHDDIDKRYPIVSEETTQYIDRLRKRYGLKGLTVAVVASPEYTRSEDWHNQTISLGQADVAGAKVTDEVRSLPHLTAHQGADGLQTLFAIASNSKLFTSVATQMLVANETILPNGQKLKLSTKVKDILGDDWVLQDKYAEERVDLIDLLSELVTPEIRVEARLTRKVCEAVCQAMITPLRTFS